FFVTVTLDNPHAAQQVCTAVTSLFIEENLQLRQEHSEDTTDFLTQQLSEAKANLDAQDTKLAAFQGQHFGSLPENEQMNLNILTGLNAQLAAVTQAQSGTQQSKSFAESMLSEQIALQSDHNSETLAQKLVDLQNHLADLRVR